MTGFAFPAVLRDDDPRHRLEHLAVTHQGPLLELLRRDGALARRLGDPHEVLCRVLDVGEIGEGSLGGHGHIGVQREVQHDIDARRPATRHDDLATRGGEVDQPAAEFVPTKGESLESKPAVAVCDDLLWRADGGSEFHGHAG